MKFNLGDFVCHTVDDHLAKGVIVFVMAENVYKVAWIGPGFISSVHEDFLRGI